MSSLIPKMKLEYLLSDDKDAPSSAHASSSRDRRSSSSRTRTSSDGRRVYSSPRSVNSSNRDHDMPPVSYGFHSSQSKEVVGSSSTDTSMYSSGSSHAAGDYGSWPEAAPSRGSQAQAKQKVHKCFCGRAFNKREHLKRHNLLVHQELRPFTCQTCDLHFGTKQNMQVHLTTRKHRQRLTFLSPHSAPPM